MFRLKIGILDDYQGVALSLADWSSLDADVEVFTAPFVDADEVVDAAGGLLTSWSRCESGPAFPPKCCRI